MGLLGFFKDNNCKECKKNFGQRFCLKKGKEICWSCCNETRVKKSCPESCPYSLKKEEKNNNLQLETKTDSYAEHLDLLKKNIDAWIKQPQEIFDNKIPYLIANIEEDKENLNNYFKSFKYRNVEPFQFLKKTLKLNIELIDEEITHPETIASDFLKSIMTLSFEDASEYLAYFLPGNSKEDYSENLFNHKIFRKIEHFEIVNSAYSRDKSQILIFFRLNFKTELTLHLINKDNIWKISSILSAKPELYQEFENIKKQIALKLQNRELGNVYSVIRKSLNLYLDSPDMNYFAGMYYLFSDLPEKAIDFFRKALLFDPFWSEPYHNLGIIYISMKKYEEAKSILEKALELYPENIQFMNNYASALIDLGETEKAGKILKKCLEADKNFEPAKKNAERIQHAEKG